MRTEAQRLQRPTSVLSLVGYPLLMFVINGGIFAALTFAGQAGAEPPGASSRAAKTEEAPTHASHEATDEKAPREFDLEGLDRQINLLDTTHSVDDQDAQIELADLLATVVRKQQIQRRQLQMKHVLPVRHFGGY